MDTFIYMERHTATSPVRMRHRHSGCHCDADAHLQQVGIQDIQLTMTNQESFPLPSWAVGNVANSVNTAPSAVSTAPLDEESGDCPNITPQHQPPDLLLHFNPAPWLRRPVWCGGSVRKQSAVTWETFSFPATCQTHDRTSRWSVIRRTRRHATFHAT